MLIDPKISALLVTPNKFEQLNPVLSCLHAQTIKREIELVIVSPSKSRLNVDNEKLRGFHSVKFVDVGPIRSAGGAIAAAVRAASADIVAYAEEHTQPQPLWAESLVDAFGQGWGAVGASVSNANPQTLWSWAVLFCTFGAVLNATESKESNALGWHHIAYLRKLLLDYDDLDKKLETEGLLLDDLRARGYKTYLEARAQCKHLNVSIAKYALGTLFNGGRLWSSERATMLRWSPLRRLFQFAIAPLIMPIRFKRLVSEFYGREDIRLEFRRAFFLTLVGVFMHSAGEMIGSIFGEGNSRSTRCCMELNRYQFLRDDERLAFESTMFLASDASSQCVSEHAH